MYIYAEYLLIENIIINFIILYVTNRITRTKTNKLRLLIASLVGSIYTLVVFFPSLQFMGKFIIKFSVSILMILLAFNPDKLKVFLRQLSTFYLISFVFAGTIIGIFYILNNKFILSKFSFKNSNELYKFLTVGIGVAIILIRNILKNHLIKINKENCLTNVTISLNNKKTDLVALIDTGNSLKEPISQKPVMIVEYSALKTILPELVKNVYIENEDIDLNFIAQIMEEIGDEIKLRLIPFRSLGNNNGILIGFIPDSIRVDLNNETKKLTDDIIVAIYNDKLAVNEQYNGLLHPEMLG